MKILVFDTQSSPEGTATITDTAELYPDSAVITDRKPLFLPDWSETFTTRVAVAARICRLGKHIALRFAQRYWNAATVCFITRGDDTHVKTLTSIFDGAIAIGSWLDLDSEIRQSISVTVTNGDSQWHLMPHADAVCRMIDQAIVTASQYTTIKMGDIIALTIGEPQPIKIGDTLNGRINEQRLLTTKIK